LSSLKNITTDKHSSLFCHSLSEEEKSYKTLTPEYLLPVLELLAMFWISSEDSGRVFWLWILFQAWASWWFVALSVR
jgi:hypothetical protein